MYTDNTDAVESDAVGNRIQHGEIIVTTNLTGRGTDLETSPKEPIEQCEQAPDHATRAAIARGEVGSAVALSEDTKVNLDSVDVK
ncbi:unnamed protein product [Didymodactylos carnosus]|uniref:Uncharacterized protein n=1 Tax=Didymodactylos carnosus TaxID=1234261 RepID=A0A815TVZ4_9BILA|nr:unnamed protein product [Didymodactylos carnosus]CAF4370246.1 unnamed protein product [Didymodactylos carnosus]